MPYDWKDALRIESTLLTEDEVAIKYVHEVRAVVKQSQLTGHICYVQRNCTRLLSSESSYVGRWFTCSYCHVQENLMPRVIDAYRNEDFDPKILSEMVHPYLGSDHVSI